MKEKLLYGTRTKHRDRSLKIFGVLRLTKLLNWLHLWLLSTCVILIRTRQMFSRFAAPRIVLRALNPCLRPGKKRNWCPSLDVRKVQLHALQQNASVRHSNLKVKRVTGRQFHLFRKAIRKSVKLRLNRINALRMKKRSLVLRNHVKMFCLVPLIL